MTSQVIRIDDNQICGIHTLNSANIPRIAEWTIVTNADLDLLLPWTALRVSGETTDGPWDLWKLARKNLRISCEPPKNCTSVGGTDKVESTVCTMTQEGLNAVVDEAQTFLSPAAVHCFTPDARRIVVASGTARENSDYMVLTVGRGVMSTGAMADEDVRESREFGNWAGGRAAGCIRSAE